MPKKKARTKTPKKVTVRLTPADLSAHMWKPIPSDKFAQQLVELISMDNPCPAQFRVDKGEALVWCEGLRLRPALLVVTDYSESRAVNHYFERA